MAWCKFCGAQIDWIRTPAGKYMTVEYRPVIVTPGRGTEIFITDEGETIKGRRTLPGAVGGGNIAAYMPHWPSCSAREEQSRGRGGASH